jgi:RNA polymerase sigma factor (sigma-70 family)
MVTTNPEWAELVTLVAQNRDRAAFTRLFDHFGPRIKGFLLRTGSDNAMAEEITQDVMVTLWRKAELFDRAKSSVPTWLYRIARNRRIDAARRNRVDFVDPMDSAFTSVAEEGSLDIALDGQQREEAVREAMKSLPEEQLSLVRLAFFDGLSHSQIAEKTGLPLGTVKSRIRLSFSRLRRELERGGVVEAQ